MLENIAALLYMLGLVAPPAAVVVGILSIAVGRPGAREIFHTPAEKSAA